MNTKYWKWVKLLAVPLGIPSVLSGCAGPTVKQATLPIYRVTAAPAGAELVQRTATALFGARGKVETGADRLKLEANRQLVEVYPASGGIWAADESRLWNPNLVPRLPGESRARAIGEDLLQKNGLLPTASARDPFTVSFASYGRTVAAIFEPRTRQRTNRQLDIQVRYGVQMAIPRADSVWRLPVVGGGGEFNLALGDGGRPIGFSGSWRRISGVETEAPLIPRSQADEQFRSLVKNLEIRSFEAFLAYYSAPPSVEQHSLYPVYVYRASAVIGGQVAPLRMITIPATTWGPKREPQAPLPRRTSADVPQRRSTMPEGAEESGERTPEAQSPIKPSLRSWLPRFASDAWAQTGSWREAGTSWIGESGGLGGSKNNAKGFVDGLAADGWTINFNWGDGDAWESDWRRNDDQWVDAADFVFYTGHASMNGWSLSNPDDGSLAFTEVGGGPASGGDLWGSSDLEWAIIAACGPLQDAAISPGGGDVFDRWDGAFDRLHQLLGYGAITFDNEEEGKIVAREAREGKSVISAWFRAARETQPADNGASAPDGPSIWVGVMYVGRSGADPGNDHIWGHGSVSADPSSPTYFVAIWTTT